MLTLNSIAEKYAEITGCDEATAEQAAFVASALLADLVGRRDIGDYFSARASEMEQKKTGIPAIPFSSPALYFDGQRIAANDRQEQIYRPGGVWHWE